jgi:hypothetical protein
VIPSGRAGTCDVASFHSHSCRCPGSCGGDQISPEIEAAE